MAKRERPRTINGGGDAARVKSVPGAGAGRDAGEGEDAPPNLDRLRLRAGELVMMTRETLMRDFEAVKHLAFDKENAPAAVRAIELQGRLIGAFREPDEALLRDADDEEIVAVLSRGNPKVADWLRVELAIGSADNSSPGGAVPHAPSRRASSAEDDADASDG